MNNHEELRRIERSLTRQLRMEKENLSHTAVMHINIAISHIQQAQALLDHTIYRTQGIKP